MSNFADLEFYSDFHYGEADADATPEDGHVRHYDEAELARIRAEFGIPDEPPF